MLFLNPDVFIFDESFSQIYFTNPQLLINYFNSLEKLKKIIYLAPIKKSFFNYSKIIKL